MGEPGPDRAVYGPDAYPDLYQTCVQLNASCAEDLDCMDSEMAVSVASLVAGIAAVCVIAICAWSARQDRHFEKKDAAATRIQATMRGRQARNGKLITPNPLATDVAINGVGDKGRQLVVVHQANVRKKASINSRKTSKLRPGELVSVFEERECDGHVRVRVGKNRWVSRVTADGNVLLDVPGTRPRGPSRKRKREREPGVDYCCLCCTVLLLVLIHFIILIVFLSGADEGLYSDPDSQSDLVFTDAAKVTFAMVVVVFVCLVLIALCS
jgi:hypothetical protein